MYLNVLSFVPNYVKKHYGEFISVTMISICLSSFQLAAILSTKIHQLTISKMGRKNSILLGFLILFVTTTGLGMLALIPDGYWITFYFFACVIRFGQGYSDCLISTTQYSVVNQVYSDQKA